MIIADGVWRRRPLDRNFDANGVLPIFIDVTRHMLRGRPKRVADSSKSIAVRGRATPVPRRACPMTRGA